MDERVILHISDLHFGPRFVVGKWNQIAAMCKELMPHMVIITGDVVDSPRRTTLREAAAALNELKQQLEIHSGGKTIPFVYVPGNHDARLFGYVPLSWTYLLALLIAALFVGIGAIGPASGNWGYALLAVAALPVLLRYIFCSTNLAGIFKGMLIEEPTAFAPLQIGIIPLDSSLAFWLGAHGKVRSDMINPVKKAIEAPENAGFFWIAAVHHHPLPIPSDHFAERAMILKNAGSVLYNLISRHVPLVIHGHKHNAHFSRLLLDSDKGEREISVLAAGTATRAEGSGRQSFNVIHIDSDNRARAVVYEAKGDAEFGEIRKHHISSGEFFSRRQFESHRDRHGVSAQKLINHVAIDQFGGAVWTRELVGLKTQTQLDRCPYDFPVSSLCGHVIGARDFATRGHRTELRALRDQHHHGAATVHFVTPLEVLDAPFDCGVEYLIQNFCALDKHQFDLMYQGRADMRAGMEQMVFDMPARIAIAQCVIHIRFPAALDMPEVMRLYRTHGAGTDWTPVHDIALTRIDSAGAIFATISAPMPGARYRMQWSVPVHPVQVDAQCQRYRDQLLALSDDQIHQVQADLRKTLAVISSMAIEHFIRSGPLPDHPEPKVGISVYIFDSGASVLRKVFSAGNGTGRGTKFAFGLGLAGLAFKAKRLLCMEIGSRHRYSPLADRVAPVTDELRDLIEESGNLVAVPLFCSEAPADEHASPLSARRQPYGVLRIAFQGEHDTAFDTPNDVAQALFGEAVSNLFRVFVKNALTA